MPVLTRDRNERVPVAQLEVDDVIEVLVTIEGDERDWVKRTVIAERQTDEGRTLTMKAPEGWEEGAVYDWTPDPEATVRRVFRPIDGRWNAVAKVLGGAVHRKAIDRLFELWPEASIHVARYTASNDGVPLKVTVVEVYRFNPEDNREGMATVYGRARCRLDTDTFNRHYGLDLAFRRALREAKRAARKIEAAEAARVEFPHDYPGAPGHNPEDPRDCFTSDCRYGCGCSAGPYRSSGPDGVDPMGECPKHPDREAS